VRRPGTGRFKIENPNQQRKYDLMARESDPVAVHPTLAAGVADTVTITNPNEVEVTIVNRTGTSEIYFTYSWTGIPTAAVVGANGTLVLPAAMPAIPVGTGKGPVVLSIISTGSVAYSVEGI
jgi:hypothetical protein